MANRNPKNRHARNRFTRQRFSRIVYLFHEGETENQYLRELSEESGFKIVSRRRIANPPDLIDAAIAFLNENPEEFQGEVPTDIWIVFDDDAKPVISEVLSSYSSKVRRVKNPALRSCLHVAFVRPCIELWAVLCLKDGVRLSQTVQGHREMESLLHRHLPSYDHDRHPYFNISKMTEWKTACETARKWEETWGAFPNCQSATRFAGIYALVSRIQEGKIASSAPKTGPQGPRRGGNCCATPARG